MLNQILRSNLVTGLWLLGIVEIMLTIADLATCNDSEGLPFCILVNTLVWMGGIAWCGLLVAYFFVRRSSDEMQERQNAARVPSPVQPSATIPFSAGFISFGGLLLAVVGLGIAFGVYQTRNPSIFDLIEGGTVLGLEERLAGDSEGIDDKNREGLTPLMLAIRAGRLDMVKCLISNRASVNQPDRAQHTPLIQAIENPEIVEHLLLSGADAQLQDIQGMTPLHWAIQKKSLESARLLIQYGARMNVRNNAGDTPLLMAVKNGCSGVDLLLMHGADPNLADQIGETPLHHAASNDDCVAAKALITAGEEVSPVSMQGWTPLHVAAMNGSLSVLAVLLQSNAHVDLENKRSQTALTCAIVKNQTKAVDYLLQHGADVNKVDQQGNTYLHMALMEGQDEIVIRLVQSGADLDVANDAGVTPRKLIKSQGKGSLLNDVKDG